MNLKVLSKINESLSKVKDSGNIVNPEDKDSDNIVNPEDKDFFDGTLMEVSIWWGSGYSYSTYQVYETSEEGALDKVVAYLEKNDPDELENADRQAKELREELAKENNLEDEWEAEDLPEFYETFTYVDATREGASEPHYIYSDYLWVERLN